MKRELQKNQNTLCLEALEPRVLLDGTVNCALRGATLVINGDDLDNAIQVFVDGSGDLIVEGHPAGEFDTTTVTGDAVVPVGDVKKIKIKMRDGGDLVGFGQFGPGAVPSHFPVKLKIDLGEGNNAVGLGRQYGLNDDTENINITGDVRIRAGAGEDVVELRGVTLGGKADFKLGDGNNTVMLIGPSDASAEKRVTIIGKVDVRTGSGHDECEFSGFSIGQNLDLKLGDGDNFVTLGGDPGPINSQIDGQLKVNTGAGNDRIMTSSLSVGAVKVKTGACPDDGHDLLDFDTQTVVDRVKMNSQNNAGFSTNLATIKGKTRIHIKNRGHIELNGQFGGNFNANLGKPDSVGFPFDDGVDFIAGHIDGNVSIYTGDGPDEIHMATFGGFEITGRTRINSGSGPDALLLGPVSDMIFNSLVSIKMGSGDDTLTLGKDGGPNPMVHFSDNRVSKLNGGPGNNTRTDYGHTGNARFLRFI